MLTLTTAARNAACDAVVDLLDVGSGEAGGNLAIGTAGMASELSSNLLSNPAFGSAVVGVATAASITNATAGNTGTAAEAVLRDRDDTSVITGLTVGTSGTDIVLSSTSITSGDTISISSLTVTMPAS